MLEGLWDTYPPVPADEQIFVPRSRGGLAPTLEEAAELYKAELARKAAKRVAKATGQDSGGATAKG